MPFDWFTVGTAAVNAGIGLFNSGNSEEKRVKANDAAYKNYINNWRFNKEQIKQTNKYNTKRWEAQIENDETMRQYDFDTRNQQRDYQMSIRDYEFGQTMRMFDQQVRQRDQQLSFNQIALDSAIRQQNAAKEEAMLGFAFDDLQLNMDIRNELSGTYRSLNAEAAKQRGYRSQAAFESERNMIAGLESEGAARASGRAGRSAAKEVQATIAKNAMQEAAIAEGVTQAGFQYALSVTEIVANLNQAYDQYYLDRQAIAASRNSYEKADMVAREQINQDFQQANMNAIAAVMLEPQKQPPLPEVIMAPATKFVKPQKLSQPDHLKRGDFGGNRNTGNSGLQAATNFLSDAGPSIGQWIANL